MDFEKLNETNCRISNIKNNDRILIGGSFYGKLDLAVIADTDNFAKLFQTAAKNAQIFTNNDGMQKWLSGLAPDFNAELLLICALLTMLCAKCILNFPLTLTKEIYFMTEVIKLCLKR